MASCAAGSAYYAGQYLAECVETSEVGAAVLATPEGRAAKEVSEATVRAAYDVFSELSSSVGTVLYEVRA